jgi:hypothetical protein
MFEPFFKGNAHHAALVRHLGTSKQTAAPANPQKTIEESASDNGLLNPEELRQHTREQKRRMREAVSGKKRGGPDDAGDTDDSETFDGDEDTGDDSYIGADGAIVTRNLSKSHAPGAFKRLQAQVANAVAEQNYHQRAGALAKSQGVSTVSHTTTDAEVAAAFEEMRSIKLPAAGQLTKSLQKCFGKIEKTLGKEAGTLAKSLSSHAVPKPKTYSTTDIQIAAQRALAHGQITPEQAGKIQSELDLTGGCSAASMALLRGEKPEDVRASSPVNKPVVQRQPNEPVGDGGIDGDMILKAASAALDAGAITAEDAHAINHHIGMTGKCPDTLLKKLNGEVEAAPELMTKAQISAACSKGMESGAITPAEAQHADVAMSLDTPIHPAILAKIKRVHGGK